MKKRAFVIVSVVFIAISAMAAGYSMEYVGEHVGYEYAATH